MQNNLLYTSGSSVYPGEYVPRYGENDFNKLIKSGNKRKTKGFPVNIHKSGNIYIIGLAIPVVERENLIVKICENILSVLVIYDNDAPGKPKKFQLREFDFDGVFSRDIVLPYDADPVFISAEYRSGILQLHIPKSKHPVKRIDAKIAVY